MSVLSIDRMDSGVRVLTLDNSSKRNAIDAAMQAELVAAVHELTTDRDARVLVVRGEGPAFCSGGDLPDLLGGPGQPVGDLRDGLMRVYDSFLAVGRLAIPSIAVVHGAAVGAGINLAMACDLRIVSPAAFFDPSFSRIGIHPGGGASHFLVDALGREGALEALLRAEHIGGPTLVERGLASACVEDPLAHAMELAELIASRDPELVRDIKASVRLAARGDLDASLQQEAWSQAASLTRTPAVLQPRAARKSTQT